MLNPDDFELLDSLVATRPVPIRRAMEVLWWPMTTNDDSEFREAMEELLDMIELHFAIVGVGPAFRSIDRMMELGWLDRGQVRSAIQATGERIRERNKEQRRRDAEKPCLSQE